MSTTNLIETAMTEALGRFLDLDVARTKLISLNIANLDTPGYRTRDLDFRTELRRAAGDSPAESSGAGIYGAESRRLLPASFSPVTHQVRGLIERPDGNNVSIERESLLLAEAQMRFNLGVQLLKDQFHTISLAINSGGTTS